MPTVNEFLKRLQDKVSQSELYQDMLTGLSEPKDEYHTELMEFFSEKMGKHALSDVPSLTSKLAVQIRAKPHLFSLIKCYINSFYPPVFNDESTINSQQIAFVRKMLDVIFAVEQDLLLQFMTSLSDEGFSSLKLDVLESRQQHGLNLSSLHVRKERTFQDGLHQVHDFLYCWHADPRQAASVTQGIQDSLLQTPITIKRVVAGSDDESVEQLLVIAVLNKLDISVEEFFSNILLEDRSEEQEYAEYFDAVDCRLKPSEDDQSTLNSLLSTFRFPASEKGNVYLSYEINKKGETLQLSPPSNTDSFEFNKKRVCTDGLHSLMKKKADSTIVVVSDEEAERILARQQEDALLKKEAAFKATPAYRLFLQTSAKALSQVHKEQILLGLISTKEPLFEKMIRCMDSEDRSMQSTLTKLNEILERALNLDSQHLEWLLSDFPSQKNKLLVQLYARPYLFAVLEHCLTQASSLCEREMGKAMYFLDIVDVVLAGEQALLKEFSATHSEDESQIMLAHINHIAEAGPNMLQDQAPMSLATGLEQVKLFLLNWHVESPAEVNQAMEELMQVFLQVNVQMQEKTSKEYYGDCSVRQVARDIGLSAEVLFAQFALQDLEEGNEDYYQSIDCRFDHNDPNILNVIVNTKPESLTFTFKKEDGHLRLCPPGLSHKDQVNKVCCLALNDIYPTVRSQVESEFFAAQYAVQCLSELEETEETKEEALPTTVLCAFLTKDAGVELQAVDGQTRQGGRHHPISGLKGLLFSHGSDDQPEPGPEVGPH